MGKRSGLNCRDGFCGALDCETCYGIEALRYRLCDAHDNAHDTPQADCPVCVMRRYERMCRHKGVTFPKDLMGKAWDHVAQAWEAV